jgi:Zn-dependent oligopeptidase
MLDIIATPCEFLPLSFGGGEGTGANSLHSSEVYSADIFATFFKDDPMNSEQGRKYRHKLLEPGGSRPEMETLLAYLGRQPDPEPFLKSLGMS